MNLYSLFKSYQNAKKAKTFISISGLNCLSVREMQNNGFSFHKVYNYEKDFNDYISTFGNQNNNENIHTWLEQKCNDLIFEADNLGIELIDLSKKQASKRLVKLPEPKGTKSEEIQTVEPETVPEIESKKIAEITLKLGELLLNVPSESDIKRLIEIEVNERLKPVKIVETVYLKNEVKTVVSGLHHKDLTTLVKLVNYEFRSVWLNGEMGTSKTHSVKQVAEILKLPFYAKSCGNSTQAYEFLGYNDAKGTFVETDFYKAYKNGGVFCLDEVDNSSPNVLSVLNSALSNSFCSFANGMIERHKDFKLVATANTVGNGANEKYIGRLKIDDATKDRFNFLNWPYDLDFERKFSGANEKQFSFFMALREEIKIKNLFLSISVRTIKSFVDLSKDFSNTLAFQVAFWNKLNENDKLSLKPVLNRYPFNLLNIDL